MVVVEHVSDASLESVSLVTSPAMWQGTGALMWRKNCCHAAATSALLLQGITSNSTPHAASALLSLKPMYNVEMCRAFGVALLLCLCSIVMIWPRHDHSIAAVLATAQQEHDNNMARSKQDLGKDTAMAWQEHGNSRARAWQDHDQDTTRTWQEHGKDMAIAWRDHRKNMARAWKEHVNGLAMS